MVILLRKKHLTYIVSILLVALLLVCSGSLIFTHIHAANTIGESDSSGSKTNALIKWVDFNVPYEALSYAMKLDIDTHDGAVPLHWIELLAYLSAKNGNNYKNFKTNQLDLIADKLKSGATIAELTKDMKYYSYYYECYDAILSGFVGEYEIEVADKTSPTGKTWVKKYGLKAFSPIAKNYPYADYDDFGAGRSYGFDRKHLGHDMMGAVGTPIIAVESGTVEALGWNQYGGWRIGIRSFDKKRYYYYAHLRQNFPYNKSLKVGSVVTAGDVIGYLGHTGYSLSENANNIKQPHLHFGMQLVFDESQKECNNEIWIDVYPIARLLYRNRSEVVKNNETKEYSRVYAMREIPAG